MDILLTALQLVLAVIAVYACVRCEILSVKLGNAVAICDNVQLELDALRKAHYKLRGAFYETKRDRHQEQQLQLPELATSSAACDNWATAQRDGPTSTAAACECAYCTMMREARAAFRAQHVPKTVLSGKVKAAP